ncbi:MAG: TetR/AcrR family transcriptional regulator [Methanosarcina sp.]
MDNKERIIEGAAGLFRLYGIKAVTMDSIANHLGISKRTIYENFSDKDELLIGVLTWMNEKQKEFLKKILTESNPIEAIFRILEMNRSHFQSMSPAFQADLKKFFHSVDAKKCQMPDYSHHQEIIERGIQEKLFRNDLNPDLANRCLYFLGRTVMDDELYPFDLFSRNDVIRNTFINYLKGISTTRGLDLINKLEANFIRIS